MQNMGPNRKTVPTVLTARETRSDQRTPTTTWRLMVWAYKTQMVRSEAERPGVADRFLGYRTSTAVVCDRLQSGWWGGGCLAADRRSADADAFTVHGWVQSLSDIEALLLMRSAEAGREPCWSPELPRMRIEPEIAGRGGMAGVLYVMPAGYPYCPVRVRGDDAAREAILRQARDDYGLWWRALSMLTEAIRAVDNEQDAASIRLTRWRISGIGAEREPWLQKQGASGLDAAAQI